MNRKTHPTSKLSQIESDMRSGVINYDPLDFPRKIENEKIAFSVEI